MYVGIEKVYIREALLLQDKSRPFGTSSVANCTLQSIVIAPKKMHSNYCVKCH